jgi:cytochrome c oxidase subunit 1
VFGIFAGIYYWIGKMSGRQYPEWAGKIHFWAMFIGVEPDLLPAALPGSPGHAAPLHRLSRGLRLLERVLHRRPQLDVPLHRVEDLTSGERVAPYWGPGATSLEWTVPSPPPFHTFEDPPHITASAGH